MLTATESDLLYLFETEPTLLDATVPWRYNRATYETQRGSYVLRLELEPESQIVFVTIDDAAAGNRIFEFEGTGIFDLRVLREPRENREWLEITIHLGLSLTVETKPRIVIKQWFDDVNRLEKAHARA